MTRSPTSSSTTRTWKRASGSKIKRWGDADEAAKIIQASIDKYGDGPAE